MAERRRTSTSNFGVGARESHDASGFYQRFRAPNISDDSTVLSPVPVAEPFVHGDARHMDAVADGSVALVVTSPPYFAGKQYEEELERDGVPSTYLEYLQLLTEVFAECVRKLEPGGRIAVNVANLGRKPYRSLSSDVTRILAEELGLLLRAEIIWRKAEGASGSCAWGSFRQPSNPVLRDVTERVIVASKGRFDRALTVRQRQARGLPYQSTLSTDDFLALTLDVWNIPAESARRVGHPAPFPVELPEQLIRLYSYRHDLILDPFMGSGSTLVASARTDRRFVGYDLDSEYVEIARNRVATEGTPPVEPQPRVDDDADPAKRKSLPLLDPELGAQKLAEETLDQCGFSIVRRNSKVRKTGVSLAFEAEDAAGTPWFFYLAGPNTTYRGGLSTVETVWQTLGRASALHACHPDVPLVVLTSALPRRPGDGDTALRAVGPSVLFDVVDITSDVDRQRLTKYSAGGATDYPLEGFWNAADLANYNPPTV